MAKTKTHLSYFSFFSASDTQTSFSALNCNIKEKGINIESKSELPDDTIKQTKNSASKGSKIK